MVEPARTRLFCFPYAGGASTIYHGWQQALGPSVEVRAVELPGRGRRFGQDPIADMTSLTRLLADELQSELEGDFAFYGHSVGAMICFELSRTLRERGRPLPRILFLAAKAGPEFQDETQRQRHLLPDEKFKQMLNEMGGTPEALLGMDEVFNVFLPILRADFALWGTYVYRPQPPLPVTLQLFGGSCDKVSAEELMAWSAHFSDYTGCEWYDAGHFFVHSHANEILQRVGDVIALRS